MSRVVILHENGPTSEVFGLVYEALEAARAKFPLFPIEPCAQHLIISEELLEVAQEVNRLTFGPLAPKGGTKAGMYDAYVMELAQTAVSCIRSILSIRHLAESGMTAHSPMQMPEGSPQTPEGGFNPYNQIPQL